MPLMPVKLSVIEDRDDFIIKSEFCSGFRGSRLHFHSVLLLTADCVTLASLYQAAIHIEKQHSDQLQRKAKAK